MNQTFSERDTYTNQAFSPPPKLVLEHLRSLAHIRKSLIEEHLFDLQTNASYMKRFLKALKNATMLRYAPDEVAAGIVLTQYFTFLSKSWQQWHILEEEFVHAQSIFAKSGGDIVPGQPLPKDLDRALGSLELVCVNTVIVQCKRLKENVPYLQDSGDAAHMKEQVEMAFKGHTRKTISDPRTRQLPTLRLICGANPHARFRKDPLDWCLNDMVHFPDAMEGFDHSMTFTFLERFLADGDPGQVHRLDDIVVQTLSDLAAAHEMLIAIRHLRPRNTNPNAKDYKGAENRTMWQLVSIDEGKAFKLGTTLTNAYQDFYDELEKTAPSAGMRPDKKLEHVRQSRQCLEKFWEAFRKFVEPQYLASELNEQQVKALMAPLFAAKCQEYAELVQCEEAALLKALSPDQVAEIVGDFKIGELSDIPGSAKATKIKTRPHHASESNQDDLSANESLASPDIAAPPSQIHVHKQHHTVFMNMYPETVEEKAKKTKWSAFVDAMYSAGCTMQNCGGSAVAFSDSANGKGKVVFHKGHPDSDIDSNMLRVYGRKLRKWFGWDRECFTVK